MKRLVVAIMLLAALVLAVPTAQATPVWEWVELGFKSSIDNVVYDTYATWPPTGAVFSPSFLGTGLGTVTYTFNTPGTHYVAGFFDYQYVDEPNNNGFFDEEAWWGGLSAGWSGKSNDPWDPNPSFPPPIYDQFVAFDATHPFDNWAWDTPGHDVAMAYGHAFTLAPGVTRKVTFTVTDILPSSYVLRQIDGPSGNVLYFSGTTADTVSGVPDSGSTLTLLGLGLAALARRLRHRT